MNQIEIFHYYRQDIINSSYGMQRFFTQGRKKTTVAIKLDDVMKRVRRMKDACRADYETLEEVSLISTEAGETKKEYRIFIFGDNGEIGFLFQLRTPIFIDERIGARGSPAKRFNQRRMS